MSTIEPIAANGSGPDLVALTVSELARVALVSPATARRLIASGRIAPRATDLLGRPLFASADVEELRRARWEKTRRRFLVAPVAVRRALADEIGNTHTA